MVEPSPTRTHFTEPPLKKRKISQSQASIIATIAEEKIEKEKNSQESAPQSPVILASSNQDKNVVFDEDATEDDTEVEECTPPQQIPEKTKNKHQHSHQLKKERKNGKDKTKKKQKKEKDRKKHKHSEPSAIARSVLYSTSLE